MYNKQSYSGQDSSSPRSNRPHAPLLRRLEISFPPQNAPFVLLAPLFPLFLTVSPETGLCFILEFFSKEFIPALFQNFPTRNTQKIQQIPVFSAFFELIQLPESSIKTAFPT